MGKENVESMIEMKFILEGVAQLPKKISVWEDSFDSQQALHLLVAAVVKNTVT